MCDISNSAQIRQGCWGADKLRDSSVVVGRKWTAAVITSCQKIKWPKLKSNMYFIPILPVFTNQNVWSRYESKRYQQQESISLVKVVTFCLDHQGLWKTVPLWLPEECLIKTGNNPTRMKHATTLGLLGRRSRDLKTSYQKRCGTTNSEDFSWKNNLMQFEAWLL